MPGAGKDLFGTTLSWIIKTCFKDKTAFRDERPRRLYGFYEPFDEDVLLEELNKMNSEAKGILPREIERDDKETVKNMQTLTNEWLRTVGQAKLQNAVLYLTEFWRYMHNRRPHNPMGILMGGILKQWRHLDLLVIGTVQQKKELDRISCLPYITHEVRCSWSLTEPYTGEYKIFPVKLIGSQGVLQARGRRKKVRINGKEPRDFLGGECLFRLYNTKSKPQMAASLQH
jgi:hypothetical protein